MVRKFYVLRQIRGLLRGGCGYRRIDPAGPASSFCPDAVNGLYFGRYYGDVYRRLESPHPPKEFVGRLGCLLDNRHGKSNPD